MSLPLVFIAGPYTKPDPIANTHEALSVAAKLLDTGLIAPVVPHLTLVWHLAFPRPYEDWLAYDMELLARCDALLRIPGESPGADGEEASARRRALPVFYFPVHVIEWARHEKAMHE